MNKLRRLGEIIQAFDAYDVFEFYKLSGASALQFLIFDIGFVTNELNFDLDTTMDVSKVNQIRNLVNKELPKILQKINFTMDVKKSKLTGKIDSYVLIDHLNKEIYTLNFNYLNRVHILNPEYFARIDHHFDDLHINALSNLENYAKYIVEILEGRFDDKILNNILDSKKILPQQFPFVRKLVAFYISISDYRDNIDLNAVDERLKDILSFNESEDKYLKESIEGLFNLSLILPATMATKMENHPKIKLMRQDK